MMTKKSNVACFLFFLIDRVGDRVLIMIVYLQLKCSLTTGTVIPTPKEARTRRMISFGGQFNAEWFFNYHGFHSDRPFSLVVVVC